MARRWLPVLILIVAFGCKKKQQEAPTAASGSAGSAPEAKYAAEWNVTAVAGVCSATEHGSCPPDKECEPPPPRAIECPAGLVDGATKVVQLEDKSCAVIPGNAKTPCPLAAGESLPPLSWAVTPAPDGTCIASWTSPGTGTKSVTIACPVADEPTTITRAKADAPCIAEGKETPCPAEPEETTVAKLRETLAPFRPRVANDAVAGRVRIKGYYVKSMVAQQASGKTTTYMFGVADPKGDAKTAIKCTSIVPLGEAADGDEVIVEGAPKKGTNNEVSLLQCQATKP
jgi:hypothetical protein